MGKEDELKDAVLRAISNHTSFSIPEIKNAYDNLGSYDQVIEATNLSRTENISLHDAAESVWANS